MTLEALRKCGTYSASEIKNIKNYCEKFPEALCRLHWGWDCLYPRKYSHVLHIHACFCISGIACSYSHVAGLGDTMTKWASTMSSLKIAPCTKSLTPRVKLRKPSAPKLGIWIMFAWCDTCINMSKLSSTTTRATTMHQDSLWLALERIIHLSYIYIYR